MLNSIGVFFADKFRRWLPDSFIFAILLTIIAAAFAFIVMDTTPIKLAQAWYKGFWMLLQFGMQVLLTLATGYAVAISPPAAKGIDWLAKKIHRPMFVYLTVTFVGGLFSLVSWSWIALTAVLGRELAQRVDKVDYRLLAACVYISILPWHGGLSGTIPLVLNTPDNFLMKAGTLAATIPVSNTLGSTMNIVCNLALILTLPILIILMRPHRDKAVQFKDLLEGGPVARPVSVAEEAASMGLPSRNISDTMNNSFILQILIAVLGVGFLIWHFSTNGFDINLDIMNLLFIMIGMICHGTPLRYIVAMKRACANNSGIVLQFPFYAGIMGIMIYTGLGAKVAAILAASATVTTLPFVSFLIGGFLNIFIPSGGGEWAVVGPTMVQAASNLGAGMPPEQLTELISRVSMAVAYGDSWTNMIQPFWTLAFFPVIAAGVRLQARDIMGYTFVGMLWSFVIFAVCVTFLPI